MDNRVDPVDTGSTFFLLMILKQVSYHNALYTLDLSGTGIERTVAQIYRTVGYGTLRWDSGLPCI